MVHYFTHWSAKKWIAGALLLVSMGISHIADAKAYACDCSFRDNGSSYSVSYVAEGGGCCSGYTSNGSGLVDRTGNGPSVHTYVEGNFAQSLCCGSN